MCKGPKVGERAWITEKNKTRKRKANEAGVQGSEKCCQSRQGQMIQGGVGSIRNMEFRVRPHFRDKDQHRQDEVLNSLPY